MENILGNLNENKKVMDLGRMEVPGAGRLAAAGSMRGTLSISVCTMYGSNTPGTLLKTGGGGYLMTLRAYRHRAYARIVLGPKIL